MFGIILKSFLSSLLSHKFHEGGIAKQLQSATIILYMNDNYGMIVHILVMWILAIQIQISHLTFFWIPFV